MQPGAPFDRFDMTDRTVVITGGTRGIGLALTQAYVAAGANVVVASRKAEACEEVANRFGSQVLGVPTHMGELGDVEALAERAAHHFGGIDVVVNNAANALAQPVGGYTPEAWAKSFDVNLRGPVFLTQAALPHLEASDHAAVLNVISAGAFMFSAGLSMYAAGKAALMSFTRSMAAELGPKGIRVNALAPGTVNTDMVRNNSPEMQDLMASAAIMNRLADPEEMVGPALLLTSDAGSFITGQVLLADGGMVPH